MNSTSRVINLSLILFKACSLKLLLAIALFFTGCEKNIFFRNEPVVTEKIILDRFEGISINSIFDIELRNDTVYSVVLTGRQNILDNITVKTEDFTLELTDENNYRWMPDYPFVKLLITIPDARDINININSPSFIYSTDTLHTSRLTIISGTQLIRTDLLVNSSHISLWTTSDDYGHYTFSGNTETSDMRLYGSSQLWADKLESGSVNIRNYSIGDCHVNVTGTLRVWLGHYGNVYYSGSPDEVIIELKRSTGRLIEIPE